MGEKNETPASDKAGANLGAGAGIRSTTPSVAPPAGNVKTSEENAPDQAGPFVRPDAGGNGSRPHAQRFFPENIPQELKDRRQWVLWRLEPNKEGDPTKRPYQIGGALAKPNDPLTWNTFEACYEAWQAYPKRFHGLGFVFSEGDSYTGIDLDNCFQEGGKPQPWAREILDRMTSYTERSQSGRGLHIITRAPKPEGRCKKSMGPDKQAVEIYSQGRYFVMTGDIYHPELCAIQGAAGEIMALHSRLFPPKPAGSCSANGGSLSDQELLDRARQAKNGPKFISLFDRGDISAYEGDDSRADLALCNILAHWTRGDARRMDQLFRQSRLYRPKWDRADYSGATIYKAIEIYQEFGGTIKHSGRKPKPKAEYIPRQHVNTETGELSELPEIAAGDGDLTRVTGAALKALLDANDPPAIFRHGGILTRIESDDNGGPSPREVTPDRMRHALARAANWIRGTEEKQPAKPPMDVVRGVLAMPDLPFPILERIVEAPVFAHDGSLLTRPGYHPANRTIYRPDPGFTLPPVPENPTEEEVKRARFLILVELLGDFPFTSSSERAHAVALLLLPFVRDMIDGGTPLHLIEAPSAGTGKSLLAECLLRPAIGRAPGLMTEGRDEEEWRKRLTAILKTSPTAIVIDNLRRRLDSAQISAALTARYWEDRMLGLSEIIRLPVRCAWVATGNNPALSTEIARRCIRIRLDSMSDRPFLRGGFTHELPAWAMDNRPQLVAAALTLVQAWVKAGKPKGTRTLGSFQRWAEVMGGILDVCEIPDFLENAIEFYEASDVEGTAWRTFVGAWWDTYKSQPVTISNLWERFKDSPELPELGDGSEKSQQTRLGILIRGNKDRDFGDLKLVQAGEKKRLKLWKLLQKPKADEGGNP